MAMSVKQMSFLLTRLKAGFKTRRMLGANKLKAAGGTVRQAGRMATEGLNAAAGRVAATRGGQRTAAFIRKHPRVAFGGGMLAGAAGVAAGRMLSARKRQRLDAQTSVRRLL